MLILGRVFQTGLEGYLKLQLLGLTRVVYLHPY